MSHAHRLRTGRMDIPGTAYVCTSVAWNRAPVFAVLANGRFVVNAMRAMDSRGATRTIAFVVMPDHLHWLFALGEGEQLSQVIGYVKRRSALCINRSASRRGRLWQPGFHDRAIRREEDVRAIARYIVFNPVRAGLVRSVRDYALWDAMWL